MRALLPPFLALCSTGCETAQSSAPLPISPYVATAVGRIDSADEARQLAAAADGVIKSVWVARGQRVSRGQKLLSVYCDPRALAVSAREADAVGAAASANTVRQGARREEIMAARAALAGAQAEAANQQQRLDVATELIDRQFISKRELDARTNDRDGAKASVARASAQLESLENGSRLSDVAAADARASAAASEASVARASADQCILRSPITGMVLQILKHEGEFSGASRGETLIIVGDVTNLVARAEIGERDAASVRDGQAAQVWIEGQPSRWKGHVVASASVMGRRSARSLDPTDRFDRDVREVFIAFDDEAPPALVGLRVSVGLLR